jgi:hypothetical protein
MPYILRMGLTRRDFLKYSSIAAAGTALSLSEAELFSHLFAMDDIPGDNVRYIPTYCEMCFSDNRFFRDFWISPVFYKENGEIEPIYVNSKAIHAAE